MNLSRYTLKNINHDKLLLPEENIFDLPEKVLQFGTGVLLRGLPDYFIDKANRQGIFNGRIVVVKSTANGDASAFEKQDGLYTQAVTGIENGEKIEEYTINASISRVLSATEEWEQVLACAHNLSMQLIVSNTTEVGIQMMPDDIRHHPPKSFPGKLLAFLYERFQAFAGSALSGMVIVPTELIPDNGKKLESIVLELAHLNSLEPEFIEWLETHNHFCNSLVDRIVPGMPDADRKTAIEQELGYTDALLIASESYRLWAIEGGDAVRSVLTFAAADEGVVIADNIDRYRELKLRLLNGTHTLSSGIAFLSGCETVQDAMEDSAVGEFISSLLHEEIAYSIPYDIDPKEAISFGDKVMDRFRNPFIRHYWINITMQYSSKMKMRCIPLLLKHYGNNESVPERMALGFAAYLYFMRTGRKADGQYYGERAGAEYPVQDSQAEVMSKRWIGLSTTALVKETLSDTQFWDEDLSQLPGFQQAVTEYLSTMLTDGVRETVDSVLTKKQALHHA